MLLADELEAIKSLTTNWPMLAVLGTVIGWFMRAVAMPLTARHLTFMDAMELRDRMNSENSIKQTAILQTLTSEVGETNNRISEIKSMVGKNQCNVPPSCAPQLHGATH